jgi:type VI secretion system protein VasD
LTIPFHIIHLDLTVYRRMPSFLAFVVVRRVSLACLLGAGLSLAGCSSLPFMKPDATVIEATADASAQVNPDTRKRPSPVVVRLYELKARTQFDAADYLSLFERDKDVLGSELVARDEFVLRPGESRDISRDPSPDTKFLAVVVGYRDMVKSRSRAIYELEPHVKNRLVVKVDALAVSIEPAPKKK